MIWEDRIRIRYQVIQSSFLNVTSNSLCDLIYSSHVILSKYSVWLYITWIHWFPITITHWTLNKSLNRHTFPSNTTQYKKWTVSYPQHEGTNSPNHLSQWKSMIHNRYQNNAELKIASLPMHHVIWRYTTHPMISKYLLLIALYYVDTLISHHTLNISLRQKKLTIISHIAILPKRNEHGRSLSMK